MRNRRPVVSWSAATALHLKPLFAVKPPEAFVVHPHALPFAKLTPSAIAEPPSLGRQRTHASAQLGIVQPRRSVPEARPIHLQKPAGTAGTGSVRAPSSCAVPPVAVLQA